MDGKEGDISRRVILWSLWFLVLLCSLTGLQASHVLSWMGECRDDLAGAVRPRSIDGWPQTCSLS